MAGAAVGAGGYALYDNMNEDHEEEIANIEAKQEDIEAQQAKQEEEAKAAAAKAEADAIAREIELKEQAAIAEKE